MYTVSPYFWEINDGCLGLAPVFSNSTVGLTALLELTTNCSSILIY